MVLGNVHFMLKLFIFFIFFSKRMLTTQLYTTILWYPTEKRKTEIYCWGISEG